MKRRILSFALAFCMILTLFPSYMPSVSATDTEPEDDPVEELQLDRTEMVLVVGDSDALQLIISPEGEMISWSSDKPKIAEVNDYGEVTAVSRGTATITARAGAFAAQCKVTVVQVATGLKLDKTELTVGVGRSAVLTPTISPSGAAGQTVTWSSETPSVAEVDANGQIIGISVGTTIIRAQAGSVETSCAVTVVILPTSVELNRTTLALLKGQSAPLTAVVGPEDATDKTVTWTTSSKQVATVDTTGRVTAVGGGAAVITAQAGEATAECAVTVTVPVESLKLNKTELTMNIGKNETLKVTVSPSTAKNDNPVVWTSGNPAIAAVDDNGQITALGAGTAVITARAGGISVNCAVTVVIPPTEIRINRETLTLEKDQSETLTVIIGPESATDRTVTWTSSSKRVATVDENGRVTALSGGTTTITAKAGSVSATCLVTVMVPVEGLSLDKDSLTLDIGASETLKVTFTPTNATDKTVVWTTSNPAVAVVDETGKITGAGEGRAVITARSGTLTANCAVEVVIPPASIQLDHEELSILLGGNATLRATVLPENATNKIVEWTSSSESIATVSSSGRITAVGGGKATITAKAGKLSAKCVVTVVVLATELTLNQTELALDVGKTGTLKATLSPKNVTDKTVTWTSANERVATVDANGKVTAVGAGSATITAQIGTLTARCTVTVSVPPSDVKLDQDKITLEVNGTARLTATVLPENATNKTVTWTSASAKIATVDETGLVTAIGAGTTAITVKAGSKSTKCTVTVVVPADGVTLNKEELVLNVEKSEVLKATISPSNVTNKIVTWRSTNEEVATVDRNGKVTAVSVGTASVIAQADRVTAACQVTVVVPVSGVRLDRETMTIDLGDSAALLPTILPEDATDKTVTWTSSNESVAVVDDQGVVFATGGGRANITAQAGDKTARCAVTVTVPVSDVQLDNEEIVISVGASGLLRATIVPDDATDKTITWASSNVDVATVDNNGRVTAADEGTAIITATSGNVSSTCTVTVIVPVAEVLLNRSELTLNLDESEILEPTLMPENTTSKAVSWSSGNQAVAAVDENGRVTAVGGGTAIITATAGEKSASCTVTVLVPASSVTLNKDTLFLNAGKSETLRASVGPEAATDKSVEWSSSDAAVATVTRTGRVTAVAAGTAIITAVSGSVSSSCVVTVAVPASSLRLSESKITLSVGASQVLQPVIAPDNTTNRTVEWNSGNEEIATVDRDGRVSALSGGTVTITARLGDLTARCSVTVTVPVEEVRLSYSSLTLEMGKSETLAATLVPESATDKTVTWSTSDSRIAAVDRTGKIAAISGGTAVITARSGDRAADCTVTVVVPVSSIRLSSDNLSLTVGESASLTSTVRPTSATNRAVTWTSASEDVAVVDENGQITAVGGGTARITASAGGQSANCMVTVSVPVDEVWLDESELVLNVGESRTLTAVVEPYNATDQLVTWSSSNPAVATIDRNGRITALGAGTVILTASAGGKSADCSAIVTVPATGIRLDEEQIIMSAGEERSLTATVLPVNTTNQLLDWSSSDARVATVDANGRVTAVEGGTAVITVRTGTKSANCVVTVTVPVEQLWLEQEALELDYGRSFALEASVLPLGASNKTIEWSSSNPAVATVDRNGRVSAAGAGTAIITARSGNASADCTVTVVIPVTAIRLDRDSLQLNVGGSAKLTHTLTPSNATDQTVGWSSDNAAVATVDAAGKVSAHGGGTALITATSGDRTARCNVTVVVPVETVSLRPYELTINEGESAVLTADVGPEDATDKSVTWTSSNMQVVAVDRTGRITAASTGNAVVTAAAGMYSASCSITVAPRAVGVSEVRLDQQTLILNTGEEEILTATVKPDTASNRTVIWTSDNPAVATVDSNGKITALTAGRVTVTAQSGGRFASCGVTVNVAVREVRLDASALAMTPGTTRTLSATVLPLDATDKAVVWTSSDPSVVSVDEQGNIQALSEGEAVITAASGTRTASCAVTVATIVTVTGIRLNRTALTLSTGGSRTLSARVEPEDATEHTVLWSSADESIATVDEEGTVSAVAEGETTVTATVGSLSAICAVTVTDSIIPVTDIYLNQTDLSLVIGWKRPLAATILPANATDQVVVWSSEDEEIAVVDEDGMVTAIAEGETIITATAGDRTAECHINVSLSEVPVGGVTLDERELELNVGEYRTLSATVRPAEATDKTITWTSRNPSIASVDENGTVHALTEGATTITATAGSFSAMCAVTVTEQGIPVTNVRLNRTALSLTTGGSGILTAVVEPEEADQTITWNSSDPSVAIVDENGMVTAVSEGEAIITATAGGFSAPCIVTVLTRVVHATGIHLDRDAFTIAVEQSKMLIAVVEPEDSTENNVVWSSDNQAVATVGEDGIVHAVSEGEAVITASVGEWSAQCRVTVVLTEIAVTGVTLDREELTLTLRGSRALTAVVEPEDATENTVVWSTSNRAVATVDETGMVRAVGEGEAVITAAAGEFSASCAVTVEAEAAVRSAAREGNTVTTTVSCADTGARVLCAFYDGQGKLVAVQARTVQPDTPECEFTLDSGEFSYAKILLTDSSSRPLCADRRTNS